MEYVFLLHHTIRRSDDDENDKIIGIYSSREAAEQAIARLKDKPGFRDPRGEFTVGPYKLDQDYFATGFGPE